MQEFFGGIVVFTREQMEAVNGFGVNFWGWGREDDNMRLRLMAAQRWPPQQPPVPLQRRNFYFLHSRHEKAPEVHASWKAKMLPVQRKSTLSIIVCPNKHPGLLIFGRPLHAVCKLS